MVKYLIVGSVMLSNNLLANISLNELDWLVINDTVMGGVSNSRVVIGKEALTFEGLLSLENNGGFASFRAPISLQNKAIKQLQFTVKGDGKRYQLRLRVDEYIDGPAFVYSFQTEKDKSQTFDLTEQDFILMYRGRQLRSEYQFKFKDVRALGFMISNKQAGEFKLKVKTISYFQSA